MSSRGVAAPRVAFLVLILLLVSTSCGDTSGNRAGSVGGNAPPPQTGPPRYEPSPGSTTPSGSPAPSGGGGGGGGGQRPPPPSQTSPPAPDPPPAPPVRREERRLLNQFVARCQEATEGLSRANVVYDPEIQMTLGGSQDVTAVVTLDTRLPAESFLPDQEARSRPILAACEIQARLRGDRREFIIQPFDWESRSLVEALDANWTWLVAPQMSGTFSMVLELKPIVKVGGRSTDHVSSRELTTVPFPITVAVSAPADERITDMATRIRNVFDSLSGLLKALLLFLALAVALVTGSWLKGRSRSDQGSQ
jgi:hypothetical protein